MEKLTASPTKVVTASERALRDGSMAAANWRENKAWVRVNLSDGLPK